MSKYYNTTKDFEVLSKHVGEIVEEFNKYIVKRIQLEAEVWGLNKNLKIIDLFSSSAQSQQTQDITKEFQSAWTKSIRKVLSGYLKNNNLVEGSHYDIKLDGEEYEIKTTSAYWNSEWSGNKFSLNKVSKHILIKYKLGDYQVEEVGFYILDLKNCTKTKWVPGSSKGTSFSVLKIHVDDIPNVNSLLGEVIKKERAKKWSTPKLSKV